MRKLSNEILQAIVISALGSTGLFSFLQFLLTRRGALTTAVRAILRDRMLILSEDYLQSGEITLHERDNYTSLYDAYKGVQGNTFVDDLYKEVMDLPLKK